MYAWLRNGKLAPHTQKRSFAYVRRFIRFLYGEHLIELPRNLYDRIFSFETQKDVVTYPVSQVRELLASFDKLRNGERLKLFALLGLNCGMYASDIGSLLKTEWQNGRIVRKRTKTKKREGVPVVSYLLWSETQELLNKFQAGKGEYVLTSETGKALWRMDETGKEANLIRFAWGKQIMTHSALRHFASNLLKQNAKYTSCADLLLGHAPATMGERHYYQYSQELLDEALLWLRGQILGT
jgi:integrase